MSNISRFDIWKAFSEFEKREAIEAFLVYPDAKPVFVTLISKGYKFRKEFVGKWPKEKIVDYATRPLILKSKFKEDFLWQVERVWLLNKQKKILEAFLDQMKVPHNEGLIDEGYEKTLTVKKLESALHYIWDKFDKRHISIYIFFLLLEENDFWTNLGSAIEKFGKDKFYSELVFIDETDPQNEKNEHKDENDEDEVSECESFTTLDKLMFRLVVDSVCQQQGSLDTTQLGDVIEEIIALNADRRRSFFHRGFLNAVDEQVPKFDFPGANDERRSWYLSGYLVGLVRIRDSNSIEIIIRDYASLFKMTATNLNLDCGRILLQCMPRFLFELGLHNHLRNLFTNQIIRFDREKIVKITQVIYHYGNILLLRGEHQEAKGYLEAVASVVEKKGENFDKMFPFSVRRKQAQIFQHRGEFSKAENILKEIVNAGKLADSNNTEADLGLIKGNFKSLRFVLPKKDKDVARTISASLAKGVKQFEKSIHNYGDRAINAHFCLGIMEMFQAKPNVSIASDYLSKSFSGMMVDDKYESTEFLHWNRMLLSIVLLESLEEAEFDHACRLYNDSIKSEISFPFFLHERVLEAATAFDEVEFLELVSNYIIQNFESDAFGLLLDLQVWRKSSKIRKLCLEYLPSSRMSAIEQWIELLKLLRLSIAERNVELSEDILDSIQTLSSKSSEVANAFADFLKSPSNYEPAWTEDEADFARVDIIERLGKLEEASIILQRLFFRSRLESAALELGDSKAIYDRIANLKVLPKSELDRLKNSIQEYDNSFAKEPSILEAKELSVLYVGGDESFCKLADSVRQAISKKYPKINLRFIHPGWTSNWNVVLDEVKRCLPEIDVLVLNPHVRTMFGRKVRSACTKIPWFACTGKGRKSLERSIEMAALFVVENSV